MLVIIFIITSVLVLTIVPLGIYNVIKREEIIKLFGCFRPEKLHKFIATIESSVDILEKYDKSSGEKIDFESKFD